MVIFPVFTISWTASRNRRSHLPCRSCEAAWKSWRLNGPLASPMRSSPISPAAALTALIWRRTGWRTMDSGIARSSLPAQMKCVPICCKSWRQRKSRLGKSVLWSPKTGLSRKSPPPSRSRPRRWPRTA